MAGNAFWVPNHTPELYHHGIKGQKWGVRRYRAKAGKNYRHYNKVDKHLAEEHVIRKGTKMYRMTTARTENGSGSTYVTYQQADRDFYKKYIASNSKDGKAYEKEFVITKDLKIPSRDEVKSAYEDAVKALGKDTVEKAAKEFVLDDLAPHYTDKLGKVADALQRCDYPRDRKDGKYDLYDDYVTGKKLVTCTEEEYDYAERYGNRIRTYSKIMSDVENKKMSDFAFGMGTLTKNPSVKEYMIKTLSSKGYDAIVDEAGVGTLVDGRKKDTAIREGVEPLILFDRSLLKEKKTTEVDYNDMDTYRKINRGYNKYVDDIARMQTRATV